MKERKKPETKKSRTITALSTAVVDLVYGETFDPTKAQIVDEVVASSVSEGTPKIVTDVLSAEMANLLETYFADVCKAAADEIGLPYHYTSKKWYSKTSFMPKSEDEAKQFVVVFGNGRTGKAAGVRFVQPEDEPDPMLLVALMKDITVVNEAIKTRNDRIQGALMSGSVGKLDAVQMGRMLPNVPSDGESHQPDIKQVAHIPE